MNISELSTPCLLLDHERLLRNCEAMSQKMAELGIGLRPHMKTSKCVEVAKLASPKGAITVSTLKEAEYFCAGGFRDILYAVGITPDKIARAANIQLQGANLIIVTDHLPVVGKINEAAERAESRFRMLVEVDTGDCRAGVDAEGTALLELVIAIQASSHLEFAGLFTHAGQSYEAKSSEEIKAIAELERKGIVDAAKSLEKAGIVCEIVAPGSTPTAAFLENANGITEMRPGVYVFGDLHQAALGSCQESDIALSVLTQVIGHNVKQNSVLVDSGGLALSKDLSASNFGQPVGYGRVADCFGNMLNPGFHVGKVSQEHGQVFSDAGETIDFGRFPIGTRLRIYPNHACMTAAAYGEYQVISKNQVLTQWPRVNGW